MFTKGQWIILVVIAFALMLLVVGCASQPAASETTAFPVGVTFRAIEAPAAEFFLEFKADGTYLLTVPLEQTYMIPGTFTVNQDKITVKADLCTQGGTDPATYTWKFDGKTLLLNSSDDKCQERWRPFNAIWTKKS